MKKVLIFSKNGDSSTCEVIDWLDHFGAESIRINEGKIENIPSSVQIGGGEKLSIQLEGDSTPIQLEEIDAIWFRKTKEASPPDTTSISDENIASNIQQHTANELEAYRASFYQLLNTKWLNHPDNKEINKPLQLSIGQKIGFDIPPTIVCNSKRALLDFKAKYTNLIVKAIFRSRGFLIDGIFHAGFTALLTEQIISKLPEVFFPLLAQQQIEKDYEIRVFYLDGECHSMAIFSQLDNQTQVDYRHYNRTKPNRTVPFALSKVMVEKVRTFMNKVGLTSGSLDFIRAKDGKFYFLEVNPNGQFGMVSKPCNYHLEKKIAQWLTQ